MKIIYYALFLMLSFSCSTSQKALSEKDWKEASQELARDYAKSIGELYPEHVSHLGFPQFDSRTTPYSKHLEKERYALSYKWQQKLQRYLTSVKHPELKSDVEILLSNVNLEIESIELSRDQGIVPFLPLTEYVYSNLKSLFKPGAPKTKVHSALMKFRGYVWGQNSNLPLIDGYMAYLLNRLDYLKENRKRGHWPTKKEILTYLKESDEYLKEIEKELSIWPKEDWERDLKEFRSHDLNYRAYLKKYILPYARTTNRTPPDVYAFMLKDYGIFDSPKDLVKIASEDYKKSYEEFSTLAQEIGRENNLSDVSPLGVAKFLTQKYFKNDEELLKYYKASADYLLDIVKKNNLLTLKQRPDFIIRFGSTAEMQSVPAPHFDSPSLLKNDKTKGQYIIPRTMGPNGMNDFAFKEAIVNLTAHEAIPGHALQYQVMKERGTTLIRAKLAFSSANVEGWAHYAEEIVYPYLTKEEKFISLQRRLWREARMFLDPELNLGKIQPRRVLEVFIKELGFSPEFAASELKRYSYIMPGQAAAYYYGYKIISKIKRDLSNKIQNFTEKCFNDALLDLGVLPLTVIKDRMSKLNCGSK